MQLLCTPTMSKRNKVVGFSPYEYSGLVLVNLGSERKVVVGVDGTVAVTGLGWATEQWDRLGLAGKHTHYWTRFGGFGPGVAVLRSGLWTSSPARPARSQA